MAHLRDSLGPDQGLDHAGPCRSPEVFSLFLLTRWEVSGGS